MKKQSFLAAAVVIGIIAIAFVFTSCGDSRPQREASSGVPESVVRYSGHWKIVNDSIATRGRFVYERKMSNGGEYRFYCMNP